MSEQSELEKLQAMRAELEAESRSLKEKQDDLENSVLVLEEKVVAEELKKEKAVIEELKSRNKAAKEAIAELEAKKKKLETRLEKTSEASAKKEKADEAPNQPVEAASGKVEDAEVAEEGGVTVTAIDGEVLVENEEVATESTSKREKKKRRFF